MRVLHIHQKLTLIVALLSAPVVIFAAVAVRSDLARVETLARAEAGLAAIGSARRAAPSAAPPAFVSEMNRDALAKAQVDIADPKASAPKRAAAIERAVALLAYDADLAAAAPEGATVLAGLVAERLPVLTRRTERLLAIADRLSAKAALNGADRMSFLVAAGQFKAIADTVSNLTRNELGRLPEAERTRVETAAAAYRKANGVFQGAAARMANGVNGGRAGAELPSERLRAAGLGLLNATGGLWAEAGAVLGENLARDRAAARNRALAAALVSALLIAAALWAALAARRSILRGIGALENGIRCLADTDINGALPGRDRGDELGRIADAVGHFRDRTVETISERLAERQAKSDAERAAMLAELEQAFGAVVGGAAEGDFSGRVAERFDDAALNRLAERVNALVGLFEHGVRETSEVMANLAQADRSASCSA